MTKQEALKKIEELKNYVADLDKKSKIQIKDRSGNILFESDKETVKEAVEEAINENADLTDAYLYHTRFYGKGGSTKINNNQVSDFLKALGVVVGD